MISNTSPKSAPNPRDLTAKATVIPGLLALAGCILAPTAAIWWVEGFVTQDGPAHLYNAEILYQSFSPNSPFHDFFEVRKQPLPNWGGHLLTTALVATLPQRVADRAMSTLCLVALPTSLFWLRRRVSGNNGLFTAAPLIALMGMNVTWLLGFNGFLLGASLFPITLGIWWNGRDRGFSTRRAAAIGFLMVLGYFCHLVSLGLTAFGLVVLEAFTPTSNRWGRRLATLAGLAPLVPLGIVYQGLMRKGGGGLAPQWKHLESLVSPRSWINQMTWVDPISLARKDYLPGFATIALWHYALAPAVLLGLGLALVVTRTALRRSETRGWWFLGLGLLFGGLLGPDTLGANHGEYLQQRIVLLGLVALVPILPLELESCRGRSTFMLIVAAFVSQTLTVWDYASVSDRSAGAILKARDALGKRQRVATLLNDIKTPFRANPVLHVDCALGLGAGNIIWADYETRFYYFPIQFRDDLFRPDAFDFEQVALSDDPIERRRLWNALARKYSGVFDRVIVWKAEPGIDADNAEWFECIHDRDNVRILRRK